MASAAFWVIHCRLVPYQCPARSEYTFRRSPVDDSRASAMSGIAENHRMARPRMARKITPSRSHT